MPWAAAAAVASAAIGSAASRKASKSAAAANDKAIEANAYQGKIATDQYEEYKTTYRPLERSLVADAQNSDSAAEYEHSAGAAQATVSNQLNLARDRLARTPGLDPSSAAAQAASASIELKGAALGAGEQNRARTQVKSQAYAKKLDAVGLGKGLVSGASTGLANAAAGATSIARSQSLDANATAAGTGAMVSGIIGGIGKADWSKVGKLFSSTPQRVANEPTFGNDVS